MSILPELIYQEVNGVVAKYKISVFSNDSICFLHLRAFSLVGPLSSGIILGWPLSISLLLLMFMVYA